MIGVLIPKRTNRKAKRLLYAVERCFRKRGFEVRVSEAYKPCDFLVLYGWGGAAQQRAIKAHKGDYIAFDLGYWHRMGMNDRKWRVSINGFHCPELIFQGPHDGRRSKGIQAKPEHKGDSILLVGQGPKTNRVMRGGNWATGMCEQLKPMFPGVKIGYRPKPGRPIEKGVRYDYIANGELKDELRKAQLVVCRHSNVAVDACQMGVPVVCEDGAAKSIYPKLKNWKSQPSQAVRQEFLGRLGYWQWSIDDINRGEFAKWLLSLPYLDIK